MFFSVATQAARFLTGPVTLALVVRHLSVNAQGYYYTFGGIVALQVFLEMGFSQNIVQFAAHEFGRLEFTPRGTLRGDPAALARLVSLGRLAFGYYAIASLLLMAGLGGGGYWFFASSGNHGESWQGPWWLVCITSSAALLLNPAWSLLEGCNQVASIAQFRLWSSLSGTIVTASALVCGAGLYTPGIFSAFSFVISIGWLLAKWWPFLAQFARPPQLPGISWAREIWPFQWRIAISWMSGYFIFDMLNPVAFRLCGPAEAGRFGLSYQLVRMLSTIASMWLNTKIPRFGMLVSGRRWQELDALWRRATTQSLAVYLLGSVALFVALPLVRGHLPRFAQRLAGNDVFLWLCAASFIQLVISAMAYELRAHRREPYLWLSVFSALLSTSLIIPFAQRFGLPGLSAGLAGALFLTLVPAVLIYRVKRRAFRES